MEFWRPNFWARSKKKLLSGMRQYLQESNSQSSNKNECITTVLLSGNSRINYDKYINNSEKTIII